MTETRTIRYKDGRWCEQQCVGGKLNGTWTVYYASGQREWERQHVDELKEGYFRRWDATGQLVEEQWYVLDELHGPWKKWDGAGHEIIVGEFYFGYPKQAFQTTVNPDFNELIKPYYGLRLDNILGGINQWIASVRRRSARLKKGSALPDLAKHGSFWNHVSLLGVGEDWPHFRGSPLYPILQINCAELGGVDTPLSDFAFVTLFAGAGDVLSSLGDDIVIRTYGQKHKLATTYPPCKPLGPPRILTLCDIIDSFPDENDLPPGVRAFLKQSGDKGNVLNQNENLNSRIGGWPGWLQSGRTSSFGKFAFQLDSLDVENWDCGDCTIHYFFLEAEGRFTWTQEMC